MRAAGRFPGLLIDYRFPGAPPRDDIDLLRYNQLARTAFWRLKSWRAAIIL